MIHLRQVLSLPHFGKYCRSWTSFRCKSFTWNIGLPGQGRFHTVKGQSLVSQWFSRCLSEPPAGLWTLQVPRPRLSTHQLGSPQTGIWQVNFWWAPQVIQNWNLSDKLIGMECLIGGACFLKLYWCVLVEAVSRDSGHWWGQLPKSNWFPIVSTHGCCKPIWGFYNWFHYIVFTSRCQQRLVILLG